MDECQNNIIQAPRSMYRLDIRAGFNIFNNISAHQLRQRLQNALYGRNIKILELRFTTLRSQQMIKFQMNIRKSIDIEPNYNSSKANKFLDKMFEDTVKLQPLKDSEDQIQTMQRNRETEQQQKHIFIEKSIATIMKIYLNENSQRVNSNDTLLREIEKTNEKNICNAIVLCNETQYQSLSNLRIEIENGQHVFVDKPKKQIKYEKMELQKIRKSHPILGWKLGTLEDTQIKKISEKQSKGQKNQQKNQFFTYFDMKVIEQKAAKKNSSIKFKNLLMSQSKDRIKKFELFSQMFEHIIIKIQVLVSQIQYIIVNKQDGITNYYLKLNYPVKFFLSELTSKLSQDESFISDWHRLENFPLLKNIKILKDQFLRLHLICNYMLKISLHTIYNEKAIRFFDDIKNQFKIKMFKLKLIDRREVNILKQILNYEKFDTTLNFGKHSKDQIWRIKYYILCLLSKGLINAGQITQLLQIIQDKNNFGMFFYIFELMCKAGKQAGRGIEYIKKKVDQIQYFSKDLLTLQNSMGICSYIFRIHITPSGYIYENRVPQMSNRLLRQYKQDIQYFMRANIQDDSTLQIKNQSYIIKRVFRKLMEKFSILQRIYIPLGWSPSQLRSYSLWYVHEASGDPPLKRSQILNFLGQFSQILPYAKMAARIGQSFSSSWLFQFKTPPKIVQIEDIKNKEGKLFSDGIGKISKDLIDRISLKLKTSYKIGAIQIRFLGAKGILALDNSLPQTNTIHIRKSMKKYECQHPKAIKYLDILDWNKFKNGFLNRQLIILLRTRGVPDKVFINLQNQYITDIRSLTYKECTIFKEITQTEVNQELSTLDSASKTIFGLMQAGFELDKQPFFKGVLKILKRNGYQKLKEKSNINVKKSARLLGIIDQYKVLEQGQIYCRLEDPFGTQKQQTISGNVILCRNPCLHPGDIRKLRCVNQDQIIKRFQELKLIKKKSIHPFRSFINTVIFPQKGAVPITCQISGSDLDGDNFFISWDQNLVNITDQNAFVINDDFGKPKYDKPNHHYLNQQDYNSMLDFFVKYMNYQKLGKIANSHLIKADKDLENFARNRFCLELAQAHGHAVDFPKSGYSPTVDPKLFENVYPDFMEKQDAISYQSQSILGQLYRNIKDRIENLIQEEQKQKTSIHLDDDLMTACPNLDFTDNQILNGVQALLTFNQELSSLKFLTGLTNQFEVYTGNVANRQKKLIKQGRLIEQILNLKAKFLEIFFKGRQNQIPLDEFNNYNEADKEKLNGNYFTKQVKRKVILWYTLSYCGAFQDLKYSRMQHLNIFKARTEKIRQENNLMNHQEKNIGLVWFIVPKILMDMKKGSKKADLSQSCNIPSMYEDQEID